MGYSKPLRGFFIALLGLSAAGASGDNHQLALDFLLKVDALVENTDAYAEAAHIVDGVCTFRLGAEAASSASKRYDISLYRDGELIHTYHRRWLPATFRRNYTGVSEGDYTISFLAEDDAGRKGKGSVTIRVRHPSAEWPDKHINSRNVGTAK